MRFKTLIETENLAVKRHNSAQRGSISFLSVHDTLDKAGLPFFL